MGTKVGPVDEPLEVGRSAKLGIRPPSGRTFDMSAIVWRADQDGSASFFIGADGDANVSAEVSEHSRQA